LKGRLFNETAAPYTPSFAIKAGKRYNYYIGPVEPKHRLPAHLLEAAIEQGLRNHLRSEDRAAVLFGLDEEDHRTAEHTRRLVKQSLPAIMHKKHRQEARTPLSAA
jgi:hypothetical protein